MHPSATAKAPEGAPPQPTVHTPHGVYWKPLQSVELSNTAKTKQTHALKEAVSPICPSTTQYTSITPCKEKPFCFHREQCIEPVPIMREAQCVHFLIYLSFSMSKRKIISLYDFISFLQRIRISIQSDRIDLTLKHKSETLGK